PVNPSGVGSLRPGDRRIGRHAAARRGADKSPPGEELNHDLGPQGPAGESWRRRGQTANTYHRWIPGSLPLLAGESECPQGHSVTMAGQRPAHTVVGRGVPPASDVNAKAEGAANLGRARGVGPSGSGLAHGTPGFQIPEPGSGLQVGAWS